MKPLSTFLLAALTLTLDAWALPPRPQLSPPDELIVLFRPETSSSQIDEMIAGLGHRVMERTGEFVRIKPSASEPMDIALQKYLQDPSVMQAQPNYRYRMNAVPNDTKYGQYWGLKNSAQTIIGADAPYSVDATNNPGTLGLDIDAESAWNNITDCSSTIVAVVDTGINYNQEDLVGNMWKGGATYPNHGYNFVDGNNDPMDRNDHGTHVAGTIGAVGNNALGGSGICWKASLMAVKVLNAQGVGTTVSISNGIKFAADQGAKVINLSLGGANSDPIFHDAIKYAGQKGALVIAAAGNSGANLAFDDGTGTAPLAGTSYSYPCSWTESNLLCVGALDQKFGLAAFSNYSGTQVHIGAPGVNIVSSVSAAHTIVNDPLNANSNWVLAAVAGTSLWGFTTQSVLVNQVANMLPSLSAAVGFRPKTLVPYVASGVMTASKTMDLNASETFMNFYDFSQLPDGNAKLRFLCNAAGKPQSQLYSKTTDNAGNDYTFNEIDLKPCISTASTVTFAYTAPATAGVISGSAILVLSFDKLTINQTSYNIMAGTSMAAPHAAGVAAMVLSFNPKFGLSQVVNALVKGGVPTDGLNTKSISGKALSAIGSLSYVTAPTGVKAIRAK